MSVISSSPQMTEHVWCSTLYISQEGINYFSSTTPLQVWNMFVLLDCMFGLTMLIAWYVSSISLNILPVITVMFTLIQKYRKNVSQHYIIACSDSGYTNWCIQLLSVITRSVMTHVCCTSFIGENFYYYCSWLAYYNIFTVQL